MRIYDIILHTPLGKKAGELKAKIENGKIHGSLSVLGHTEPVEGTVDAQGKCTLKGRISSLMKTMDFTADGTIDFDALRLAVKADAGYYEIMGQLRKQSASRQNATDLKIPENE